MPKPKGLICEAAPMVLAIPYPARFKVAKIFLPDEPRPNRFVGLLIERKIIDSIHSSASFWLAERVLSNLLVAITIMVRTDVVDHCSVMDDGSSTYPTCLKGGIGHALGFAGSVDGCSGVHLTPVANLSSLAKEVYGVVEQPLGP